MPDRKNRVRWLVITTLSAAFVAGCGGGSGSPVVSAAPSPSAQGNQSGQAGPSQPAPSQATGSVTLSWLPPTEKIDGTPLTNLAGYRIYWGPKRGHYTNSVTIDNPGLASFVIEQLAPARWYFVVAALTREAIEGERSDVVTQTVQ